MPSKQGQKGNWRQRTPAVKIQTTAPPIPRLSVECRQPSQERRHQHLRARSGHGTGRRNRFSTQCISWQVAEERVEVTDLLDSPVLLPAHPARNRKTARMSTGGPRLCRRATAPAVEVAVVPRVDPGTGIADQTASPLRGYQARHAPVFMPHLTTSKRAFIVWIESWACRINTLS